MKIILLIKNKFLHQASAILHVVAPSPNDKSNMQQWIISETSPGTKNHSGGQARLGHRDMFCDCLCAKQIDPIAYVLFLESYFEGWE